MSRIFAIGDLHLAHSVDKPMDKFGPHWKNHAEKIAQNWDRLVDDDDLTLVCGDSSWAMRWDEFETDLAWIAARRGRKVLLRGNHDYWWPSIKRLRERLPNGVLALQNDHLDLGELAIAGSRGWTSPGSRSFSPSDDQKIYDREVHRLRLSLESAPAGKPIVCMLHYPPTNDRLEPSPITGLLDSFPVQVCVFGHLHGERALRGSLNGEVGGIRYRLVSSDVVQFEPVCIWADGAPA